MDAELQRFTELWDDKSTRPEAKAYAVAYCGSHDLSGYERHTMEDLVGLVGEARAAGDEAERVRLDIWLLATYEPQQITATFHK